MALTRRGFLKILGIGAASIPLGISLFKEGAGYIADYRLTTKPMFMPKPYAYKWRRYDSLPKATTPLAEGIVPYGRRLKVKWVDIYA